MVKKTKEFFVDNAYIKTREDAVKAAQDYAHSKQWPEKNEILLAIQNDEVAYVPFDRKYNQAELLDLGRIAVWTPKAVMWRD